MHLLHFLHLLGVAVAVGVTVDLGYQKIQGVNPGYGVSSWLGVPFANPPLGQYRWKAPADPPNNSTLLIANAHKPICLGNAATYNPSSTTTSDDCLYLDLYAPTSATTSSKLPVYIFFQGGGFNTNSQPNYNGTSLINASGGNIVVITFNYRVGMWGFLASKEVQANGSANGGLLDQRKALQWIQKYVSLFGGDPGHVTIGGASAGGASVYLHMTAYGGRDDGLFHAAAAESPSFGPQLTISEAQYQYDQFVQKVGCSGKSDTLSCLRSLSTALLQNNTANVPYAGQSGSPLYMWSNVIDGNFTVDYTYRMFAEKRYVKVPTISGADTNDGTEFAPKSASSIAAMDAFLTNNFPNLNAGMLAVINKAYLPGPIYPSASAYWPPTAQAYGEMRYLCPGLFVSNWQSRSSVNAWNYHYNVSTDPSTASGLGVVHTVETNAIWCPVSGAPASYTCTSQFVLAMQGYWTSFIRSKNPNTYRYPGTVYWGQWQPWFGQRVVINNNNTAMETPPADLTLRCAYLQAIAVSIKQ